MATARLYNLARMTTATTGTGTVTLGSAVTGFLTFAQSGVADGATVTYAIKDGNNSEIGRGVYTSSGTTLTRATIINSTNSNNALNLTGSAEVFLTPSAQDFYPVINAQTGTTYTVLATDVGKLVTLSNAASIAVTLPQATGLFGTGFWFYVQNIGAGTATITPTTSTLNGAATLVLPSGGNAYIVSDGTNYSAVSVVAASETALGIIELATTAEVTAGTDTTRAVTPAGISANFATTSEVGGVHTTGSVTSGTTSLTVASATGVAVGMYVVGEGVTPGTTVSALSGTSVTLSANAGATLSSDPVSFYVANKFLSPGNIAGQLCRAWVNFNGSGTVAILASFNVTSITDNGTGDFTLNFTNPMPDINYVMSGSVDYSTPGAFLVMGNTNTTRTTSAFRIYLWGGGGLSDFSIVSVAIFR